MSQYIVSVVDINVATNAHWVVLVEARPRPNDEDDPPASETKTRVATHAGVSVG